MKTVARRVLRLLCFVRVSIGKGGAIPLVRQWTRFHALVTAFIALGLAANVHATPSDLDRSFGDYGVTLVSPIEASVLIHVYPIAPISGVMTLRHDGATLVLENGRLWLVDAQGTLDTSFGYGEAGAANGCIVPDACQTTLLGRPAFLRNGAVLIPFHTFNTPTARVGLLQLRPDGKRDPAFGVNGVSVLLERVDQLYAQQTSVYEEPDGAIRVVGLMKFTHVPPGVFGPPTATAANIYLARWRQDGALDTSFGDQGRRITNLHADHDFALEPLPGGRTLVAATRLNNPPAASVHEDQYHTFVSRLLPDGQTDPSFVTFQENGPEVIRVGGIATDSSGLIIVAGTVFQGLTGGATSPTGAFAGYRLRPDGERDSTFGSGGRFRLRPQGDCAMAALTSVAIDSRDRIVLFGNQQNCPLDYRPTTGLVARLLPSGLPDESFASEGKVSFPEGFKTLITDGAVDAEDRIVFSALVAVGVRLRGRNLFFDNRVAVFRLRGGFAPGPAGAGKRTAVEFLHAGFGHYFITADPVEAAQLDLGTDWKRTGQTFLVWSERDAFALPVCRFWSGQRFAPKSSHFYTPYPNECSGLQAEAFWTYEGDVYFLRLPEGPLGARTCPRGSQPLYRAYNNGITGAPNHRYTADSAVLNEMIAKSWSFEGEAQTRVFACGPVQD